MVFDSKFESGNLDIACKVNQNEYDLYMRLDSNTRGHHQWFYFSVVNYHKTSRRVKFNVLNFTKPNSLFNQGMKICVRRDCDEEWSHEGEDILYKLSKISHLEKKSVEEAVDE